MKISKDIIKKIKKANNIAIFTHVSPDGDAIGSSFALKYALEKLSKRVDLYIEEIPDNFSFLNLEGFITTYNNENYDLVISLDVASSHMLGEFKDKFINHHNSLSIDHHCVRESFSKTELIDNKSASNAEIVYHLILELKIKLDDRIAKLLYLGVATDTGCFMYSNTSTQSHLVASKLLEFDINVAILHKKVFQTSSLDRFKLKQLVLSNYEIYKDFIFAIIDTRLINSAKIEQAHSYNFANMLLELENMNYSCIAIESVSGEFKISMRSNSGFDCSKIAVRIGGGGHTQASGGKIIGNKNNVKAILIREYENAKKGD